MDYLQIRELYHHGIKGQKWGVRRYQYEDGSLTEEGRKRYNTGYYEDKKDNPNSQLYRKKDDSKIYYKDRNGNEHQYKTNIKDLDQKEITDLLKQIKLENSLDKEVSSRQTNNAKDAKDILDSSAKVLDATARALPTGNGKYIKKDYSKLSDQELRNKISRLQLEESYGRLSGDTKYVKSGSEKAREILQTTGAVIAIGASAAALTATIVDIRAKHRNRIGMPELLQSGLVNEFLITNNASIKQSERSGPMDYLQIRELYHNSIIEDEKIRRKNELKVINRDFYANLPSEVCSRLDHFVWDYRNCKWFDEAWEKYRKHVLDAGLGGKMKMPGFIFNTYIDRYVEEKHKNIKNVADCVMYADCDVEELYHYGIKGQKWGVRRFQNEDGSYTSAGKQRYNTDLGTKEILKNTTSYDKLTRKQQKQYTNYGKQSGAKKGFLVGMGLGASVGVGKTVADLVRSSRSREKSSTSIVNRFVRNTILGAFGGGFVGTVAGAHTGKKAAQSKLADRGKEYVDQLLQTPSKRLEE